MLNIVLADCAATDRDFAFRVAEESMRSYVEAAFGTWDAETQRRQFNDTFDPDNCRLILVDGVGAGILVVEDRPSEMFLSKIFLLPAFQGRGVGSRLLRQLVEHARSRHVPLKLRVLNVNVRAQTLYKRLGFIIVAVTPEHTYMEACPH